MCGTFDILACLVFKVIWGHTVRLFQKHEKAGNSKTAGYRGKRIEIWDSRVQFIWSIFDLSVFKVILGSLSQNGLQLENGWYGVGTFDLVLIRH